MYLEQDMSRARKKKPLLIPLIIQNPFDYPPEIGERIRWSSSKCKVFDKCKRKFYWKYIMKLRTRGRASSLLFGDYFHQGVAEWYRSKRSSMKKIANKFSETAKAEIKKTGEFYDQAEFEKLTTMVNTLTGMLIGYGDVYQAERKTWIIERKNIEVAKTMDMGDFDFIFKADLLTAKKVKSRIVNFLVEHKTAAQIPGSYIDRLPLDFQVRGYTFGCVDKRGLGLKLSEVVYDVVKKCKLRRKSNESAEDFDQRIADDYMARPEFYFFRESLKFDMSDINAFELELNQIHSEYAALIARMENPLDPREWKPSDNICTEFYKNCEYQPLCLSGLDKGTGCMYSQYHHIDWSEGMRCSVEIDGILYEGTVTYVKNDDAKVTFDDGDKETYHVKDLNEVELDTEDGE
jgi:hypothetical protein